MQTSCQQNHYSYCPYLEVECRRPASKITIHTVHIQQQWSSLATSASAVISLVLFTGNPQMQTRPQVLVDTITVIDMQCSNFTSICRYRHSHRYLQVCRHIQVLVDTVTVTGMQIHSGACHRYSQICRASHGHRYLQVCRASHCHRFLQVRRHIQVLVDTVTVTGAVIDIYRHSHIDISGADVSYILSCFTKSCVARFTHGIPISFFPFVNELLIKIFK